MKCVIKLYKEETKEHANTFMLCGTGAGNFDNHDTYQWVSYPWGTIYPEVFKTKEEALEFWGNKENVYYEVMSGIRMVLIDKDGNYKESVALPRPSFVKYDT